MSSHQRRDFLKQAGLFSAAALTSPLAASPFAQENYKAIVGHGDFKYKVDKNWGQLDPLNQSVMHCHEMVIDSRQRLLCTTVSKHFDVLAYNKRGKLENAWKLRMTEPHGLSKAGEGNAQTLWITDPSDGRVVNLDLEGRIIRELKVPADQIPAGKQFKPTETAIGSNGDIYVADGYGTNLIFHFDSKGQLHNVFGGPDHFNCCHGIVADNRRGKEELLITSRANQEFQRWSTNGKHLATRKLPGLQICRPVISGDETLFAVIASKSWWDYDGMVAVLDKNFDVVSLPGGSAPQNQEDFTGIKHDNTTFMNPHDVCPDEDGNLYVPQWYSGRTYPIRLKRV
ncbi:6-bladed beta-propeller [Neolewinella aurantiaca]|uniref:6-bladed beta-propeller n=1 Tax=Neolewinella aurantiaca TaxID=2602767 RepID=A0A5C7FF10_9BACT|nr:6-bladed beta-propeller [Neolewinella aurantiaca]TXF88139.1 6-bladed beta-propeller [Neolewinella aurantiaca]